MTDDTSNTTKVYIHELHVGDCIEVGGVYYEIIAMSKNAYAAHVLTLDMADMPFPDRKAPTAYATVILPSDLTIEVNVRE